MKTNLENCLDIAILINNKFALPVYIFILHNVHSFWTSHLIKCLNTLHKIECLKFMKIYI